MHPLQGTRANDVQGLRLAHTTRFSGQRLSSSKNPTAVAPGETFQPDNAPTNRDALMEQLPQCYEPLYPDGSGPQLTITVAGSPQAISSLGPLPALSKQVQWKLAPLPCQLDPAADLTFVLWSDELLDEVADFLAQDVPQLGLIVMHRLNRHVPEITTA